MAITKDDWEGLIEDAAEKMSFQEAKEALEAVVYYKKNNIVSKIEVMRERYHQDEINIEQYLLAIKDLVKDA